MFLGGVLLGLSVQGVMASSLVLSGGTLNLHGNLEVDLVQIQTHASLQGEGTAVGRVEVSGEVKPGGESIAGTSTFHVAGDLVFLPGGRVASSVASHTQMDRLVVDDVVSGRVRFC